MKTKMKIKHSIFIMLLIFSLVPLYLFGWFMLYANSMKIDEIVKENLAAVSGTQILSLNTFCENRRENLEILAQYQIIQDAVKDSLGMSEADPASREYLDNMLMERREYADYIVSLSVIDRNFKVVASSEKYQRSEESQLEEANEAYLTGEFFMGDVHERETEDGTIRVVVAFHGIYAEDGQLIGYVVEEIAAEYFDQFRSETNLWDSGTFYLIDGKDNTITAGSAEESNRDEYVTTKEERADYIEAWNKLDLEKNPSGEFTYTLGGQEYITYYSGVEYTNWNVRVTVNLSAQKSSIINSYKVMVMLTIVIVTGILIIANLVISRRLMKPINSIISSLKKVQEEQDYSIRIDVERQDEIAVLGGEVNDLLNYIEQENLQEKRYQRILARKAERDPLTGIRNKEAITRKTQDMIQEAVEENNTIAVGFVDIDDFRDYNTNYGHPEGDEVIRFVASVLHNELPGFVGRAGGDEFSFCISKVAEREDLERVLTRILKQLNENYFNHTAGEAQPIPCSIGVVISSGEKMNYSTLIRLADEAMYQAKEKGKNTFVIVEDNAERTCK